jgi:RimJ/RimL family protein N-acetyltransferase
MDTETSIRLATEADAEAFVELMGQVDAESDFMLFEADERQFSIEEVRQRIRGGATSQNQAIFVAERDGALVGYLLAIGGEPRRIRHRVYLVVGVREGFTGQRIGTRLFAALDEWAKSHAIERLELTVRADNARAIALYRKAGFEVEGTKKCSLKVNGQPADELSMARLL